MKDGAWTTSAGERRGRAFVSARGPRIEGGGSRRGGASRRPSGAAVRAAVRVLPDRTRAPGRPSARAARDGGSRARRSGLAGGAAVVKGRRAGTRGGGGGARA